MMQNWRKTLSTVPALLILVLNIARSVAAQEAPADDDADQGPDRRYTVEFIIFEYADSVATGSEKFIPDALPEYVPPEFEFSDEPVEETPDEVVSDVDDEAVVDEEISDELKWLTITPQDPLEFSLEEILAKLRRLDAYNPVLYGGWTQFGLAKDVAPQIHLHSLGSPPPALQGTLTLYLGRYLHLVADLTLLDEKSMSAAFGTQEPVGNSENRDDSSFADLAELTGPTRFRINEDRIVRNGEFRYYDHPKFGMLVKVIRVEIEDGEGEESESATLLSNDE